MTTDIFIKFATFDFDFYDDFYRHRGFEDGVYIEALLDCGYWYAVNELNLFDNAEMIDWFAENAPDKKPEYMSDAQRSGTPPSIDGDVATWKLNAGFRFTDQDTAMQFKLRFG